MSDTQYNQSQPPEPQDVLEKKLKKHLTREFDLGEKVISLLKQKKALETDLQEQLDAKNTLEKRLEAMLADRQKLEREFQRTQHDLREQQTQLRQRSRMISESEEDSRESLEQLRQKIRTLEDELQAADVRKSENHKLLSRTIQALRHKEEHLGQELQKITHQRDGVERQLHKTMQNFRELSDTHKTDKKAHEQQMKKLLNSQLEMENRIKTLLQQQKENERVLQEEVSALRVSKAQLERKVKELEQSHSDVGHQLDAELLQVMEKQDRYIQELKTRAHQRSALLRAENETLRAQMENIMSSQEQVKWENQMLESSLKGLQTDLAEYLQVKSKFEEAQREKENFEEMIRRKFQFLEQRKSEQARQELSRIDVHIHGKNVGATSATPSPQKPIEEKTERVHRVWSGPHAKLLTVVLLVLLLVSLTALIMHIAFQPSPSIPSRQGNGHIEGLDSLPEIELPADEFLLIPHAEDQAEGQQETATSVSEIQTAHSPSSQESSVKADTGESRVTYRGLETDSSSVQVSSAAHSEADAEAPPVVSDAAVSEPKRTQTPLDIIVQLPAEQAAPSFFLKTPPLPTAENNVVLRRHYQSRYSRP